MTANGCTILSAILPRKARRLQKRGTILLEVVLALSIFSLTAAIVFSGMSASFDCAKQVFFSAKAADLAVTKISEIYLGQVQLSTTGPNEYEEEELVGWTWELAVEMIEPYALAQQQEARTEITIRHDETGYSHRLVWMLPGSLAEVEVGNPRGRTRSEGNGIGSTIRNDPD